MIACVAPTAAVSSKRTVFQTGFCPGSNLSATCRSQTAVALTCIQVSRCSVVPCCPQCWRHRQHRHRRRKRRHVLHTAFRCKLFSSSPELQPCGSGHPPSGSIHETRGGTSRSDIPLAWASMSKLLWTRYTMFLYFEARIFHKPRSQLAISIESPMMKILVPWPDDVSQRVCFSHCFIISGQCHKFAFCTLSSCLQNMLPSIHFIMIIMCPPFITSAPFVHPLAPLCVVAPVLLRFGVLAFMSWITAVCSCRSHVSPLWISLHHRNMQDP